MPNESTGLPLDHIGIAVSSLAQSAALYERVAGHTSSGVETLSNQGVRVAFVGPVELLEPLGPDTTVGRFIARRGPGLHHIAYRTKDIRADLARLAADGFELIDQEPRPGAGGHLVTFLHPRTAGGVLIELVQHGLP